MKQVIFIMTDTTRSDMLGCYETAGMQTPNIDALAQSGVRFDRAYTCQPVCGPARSAIFTGLFPHSNGCFANSLPLYDNIKTIGQRLCDSDISTAYIGKWHLDGGDYFGNGICPDGWDEHYWYDMRNYLQELPPEERLRSRKAATMHDGALSSEFTFAHRCTQKGMEYIQKNKDKSFFLTISYDEPHGPSLCPEPFASMYRDFELEPSENIYDNLQDKPQHQKLWSESGKQYRPDNIKVTAPDLFGCNSFVDSEIGRLLECVQKTAPDSVIIFTSDHGDFIYSHQLYGKGPAAYEEITRIPLIIRDNQSVGICKSLASHIDLAPTILEMFGLEPPDIFEGKSLLKCVKDPSESVNENIFIEFGRYEIDHDGFGGFCPMRAVFDGRFKLVINLVSQDELYDLENDPAEMINLIEHVDYYTHRDRLLREIIDWQNKTRDPFRGYCWEGRYWNKGYSPHWHHTRFTRQREDDGYAPMGLDYDTGLPQEHTSRLKLL